MAREAKKQKTKEKTEPAHPEVQKPGEFQNIILDTMVDGLVVIDDSGTILRANKACQEIFGYSEMELLGRNVKMLTTEKDHDRHDGYISSYLKTGRGKILGRGPREIKGKHKDGRPLQLELAINSVAEQGRQIFVGSLRDITVRKNLEKATLKLKEQVGEHSEFQRIINETLVDGLFMINEKGIILSANQACQKIFGYLENEMIGQNIKMFMKGENERDHDQYLQNYLSTGKGKIIGIGPREVEGYSKDGTKIDLELAVNGSTVKGKKVFVGSLRDITERKSALKKSYTELEQQSYEELEQFAYVASHDLRAPLRAISNLSQWIEEDLEGILKGNTKKNMELLRGRVNRLEVFLDDILLYSRAGRVKGTVADINLNEVIADVLGFTDIPEGFQVKTEGKLPTVKAPKGMLEQIFGNFINNAIAHHDKKKGTVTISSTERTGVWEFTVADDGPGIPLEFQKMIFRMFYKLEARDENEGSGMGLAIIRKLVAKQGGEIRIESNPQKKRGTTFRFTWLKKLPRAWVTEDN